MFPWKNKTEEKSKVKVILEGCLDESQDHLQWCEHGFRTDAYCSQCEEKKKNISEDNNSFGLSVFENA